MKRLENPIIKKEKKKKISLKEQSIFELYPDYTEEQVMRAINSLNDNYIKILELKYGINNEKTMSNKEIANLLNISYSNLIAKINYIKKKISKKLREQEFYHNVTNIINPAQQEEFPTFSLEDKINEFKNLILSGQYNTNNLYYTGNEFTIKTFCYENICLFAHKDKKEIH